LIPKNVLIATGSRPRELADIPTDGKVILHSDHVLSLDTLPTSISIVGGGIIGIEWASMLTDLGVKVTVIENQKNILISEDEDVIKGIRQALKKRGVQFY